MVGGEGRGGLKGEWEPGGILPHYCVYSASAPASPRPGVPDDPRDRVLHQLPDGAQGHVLQLI